MSKLLFALIAVALSVGALAQGGGMRMMGGGGGDPTMLLRRGDVRKDLNLTDDQKTKLQTVQDKARADMQAFFKTNMASGGPPDFEKIRPQMEKMREDIKKQVDEILTPDQAKRLGEISIQLAGNLAALRKDVQDQIGLSDDQKSKLKNLRAKEQEATQAVRDKLNAQVEAGDLTREKMRTMLREKRENNRKVLEELIGKLLTKEQMAKLKSLQGAPFAAEPQTDGADFQMNG